MSSPRALPSQGPTVRTVRDRHHHLHGKQRIDRRLGQLFRVLGPTAAQALAELLPVVRLRSTLLDPAGLPQRLEPQVDALANLAEFARQFVRSPHDWKAPGNASSHDALASIAAHLLAEYPVPRVLTGLWLGGRSEEERRRRRWFVEHGRGLPLRRLDLPLPLTRRMEHRLLRAPHDLAPLVALRWAELRGLGASDQLARWVAGTRLGNDFSNASFWRRAADFLVRNEDRLDRASVRALVAFLHAIRFQTSFAVGPQGPVTLAPPQPDFSIAGRTVPSLLAQADAWRRLAQPIHNRGSTWQASRYRPMTYVPYGARPGERWELVELTSTAELRQEGQAMQHCVGEYDDSCLEGHASIWSLRRHCDGTVRSLATIEVDPDERLAFQARGLRNRRPSKEARRCIEVWLTREGLSFERCLGLRSADALEGT